MTQPTEKAGGASQRGSHRLAQVSQCERAWFLAWVRRIASKQRTPALVEGSAVHLALAYYWAMQMPTPPAWFHAESLEAGLMRETRGMPEAGKLALDVRDAYAKFYAGGDPWKPEAVEKEYFAKVGALRRMMRPGCGPHPMDEEQVSARIDLVARVNGRLWAVDHKTSKVGGMGARSATLTRWNPDGEWAHSFQFLLQTLIMRHNLGPDFGGVVVQRIKTSTPFDFDRNVVALPPQVLVDAPDTVAMQVQREHDAAARFREAVASGADPATWLPVGNLWSCWSWGRSCEYRLLCSAEADTRAQVMASEYGKRD